jgi:hypothetical protein
VEVTTGFALRSGGISYPKHKRKNFDVMAVVVNGTIFYENLPMTNMPTKDLREFVAAGGTRQMVENAVRDLEPQHGKMQERKT